ncbi:MAG: maleylacetoacetate isomerase [Rhizobiaceae bacterium]|nr:maleylacetoacetate isomerase [Rhizobiaceae bacterium]
MVDITLHSFYASSASLRVRIALNLKGIPHDQVTWNLKKKEQKSEEYLKMNPQGFVPAIEREGKPILSQSLAIIEWLEETYPEPALLPTDIDERARVRAIAYAIACDTTPLLAGRIMGTLEMDLGADHDAQTKWFRRWVTDCFGALETQMSSNPATGKFCCGDTPTLGDICIAAQVVSNKRFGVDLTPYPTISRIFDNCMAMQAFENALPKNQPDAV